MESKIKQLIKLENYPVAVVQADELPEKFLQLENVAEESFLTYDAWKKILGRI